MQKQNGNEGTLGMARKLYQHQERLTKIIEHKTVEGYMCCFCGEFVEVEKTRLMWEGLDRREREQCDYSPYRVCVKCYSKEEILEIDVWRKLKDERIQDLLFAKPPLLRRGAKAEWERRCG